MRPLFFRNDELAANVQIFRCSKRWHIQVSRDRRHVAADETVAARVDSRRRSRRRVRQQQRDSVELFCQDEFFVRGESTLVDPLRKFSIARLDFVERRHSNRQSRFGRRRAVGDGRADEDDFAAREIAHVLTQCVEALVGDERFAVVIGVVPLLENRDHFTAVQIFRLDICDGIAFQVRCVKIHDVL